MPWVVCQTKPRQEAWARTNVERQGCETYLPILRPDVRHKIASPRPLFPSYLFVFITSQWYFLRSTYGINKIVMSSGGTPAEIKTEIIDEIKLRHGKDGMIEFPISRFRIGQRVKVSAGPFIYQIGTFHGVLGKDRALVSLGNLGIATINEQFLEPA